MGGEEERGPRKRPPGRLKTGSKESMAPGDRARGAVKAVDRGRPLIRPIEFKDTRLNAFIRPALARFYRFLTRTKANAVLMVGVLPNTPAARAGPGNGFVVCTHGEMTRDDAIHFLEHAIASLKAGGHHGW